MRDPDVRRRQHRQHVLPGRHVLEDRVRVRAWDGRRCREGVLAMTDDERKDELAEETIEDLEAPAAAQDDVAGGVTKCATPTCGGDSTVSTFCRGVTCSKTAAECQLGTAAVVVKAF